MDNTNTTAVAEEKDVQAKKAEKAKAKKIKEALAKSKAKAAESKAKKAKKPAGPRKTIDRFTLSLVQRAGGVTLDEAQKLVVKEFPGHDKKTLEHTTARRLKGYLAQKYGVKITKDDHGRYCQAPSKGAKQVA